MVALGNAAVQTKVQDNALVFIHSADQQRGGLYDTVKLTKKSGELVAATPGAVDALQNKQCVLEQHTELYSHEPTTVTALRLARSGATISVVQLAPLAGQLMELLTLPPPTRALQARRLRSCPRLRRA